MAYQLNDINFRTVSDPVAFMAESDGSEIYDSGGLSMAYQLNDINFRTVSDPVAFMAESDENYRRKVAEAADRIIQNQSRSPIVLLSGPSGSGKTTTSMKIAEELNRRGVGTHYVAMDD